MEGRDAWTRRQHQRVRLGGKALVIVDPHLGMISALGRLVDLSEGGCQLLLQRRIEPHLAARVRLDLAGQVLWFPAVTRWVRGDTDGWTVGCAFDRLTTKKQDALRTVLFELSLTRRPLGSPGDSG